MFSNDEERTLPKRIADVFSFLGFGLTLQLSKVLPMSAMSFILANLLVLFSPLLPKTYLIMENLRNAMPKLSRSRRIRLMLGVWYNLGRFAGEYPYIYKLRDQEVFDYAEMSENLRTTLEELKNSTRGSIIFSGHLSNWEVGLRALRDYGLKVAVVFRRLNNHLLEPKYNADLRKNVGINMIAKQDGAALNIVRSLRRGENVVIMADQRDEMNGILVDFCGRKAYTSRSIYVLAKKMKVPVYGMRVVRKNTILSRFLLDIESECFRTENTSEEEFLSRCINGTLEKWIGEYPEQWFWIHNRWKL
ncbi:MAG: lysophospholipid acyltransferase family protein [Rickettsiales bacterium]|jgi:KDO2-lipid IV(A) lauroyltransferase|nr:lysophospholipid acyltransferase family protein [Rickettsiales bacterium]